MEWLEQVRAWKASGQSSDAFAKGKGFTAKLLRWWAWKLGREREDVSPKLARVTKAASPIEFIELVAPVRDTSGLVVRVGRVEVEIGRGFDVDTLVRVLDVLEERA